MVWPTRTTIGCSAHIRASCHSSTWMTRRAKSTSHPRDRHQNNHDHRHKGHDDNHDRWCYSEYYLVCNWNFSFCTFVPKIGGAWGSQCFLVLVTTRSISTENHRGTSSLARQDPISKLKRGLKNGEDICLFYTHPDSYLLSYHHMMVPLTRPRIKVTA